jgi:hypothetical protein
MVAVLVVLASGGAVAPTRGEIPLSVTEPILIPDPGRLAVLAGATASVGRITVATYTPATISGSRLSSRGPESGIVPGLIGTAVVSVFPSFTTRM